MPIDQQTRVGSKMGLVEQVNACLRTGHYSRALDLLRAGATEFHHDAELAKLEKLAQDGIQRNTESQRLITESQELFAQQKSSEALELLRQAYELDKKNSLARAILANALVEHAQLLVETDWLEAERLTNQALAVNSAHPTAKTILNLIVEKKKTSSVDDWVSQASKLQSSGDLFKALAWVAEGLAVHPDDPKLLQIQDAIQRDQVARRRQTRRHDMDDLRRMELEIKGATDAAAKQALAERIQGVVARYWTDGEILSIANALLLRLGLHGAVAGSHKGAPIIFHVPRPNAPKPSGNEPSQVPPSRLPASKAHVSKLSESPILLKDIPLGKVPTDLLSPGKVAPSQIPLNAIEPDKVLITPPAPRLSEPQVITAPGAELSAPAAKDTPLSFEPKPFTRTNSKTLIIISATAAMILVAGILFLTRKHPAPPVAQKPSLAPIVSTPAVSKPTISASSVPERATAQTTPESPLPAASDTDAGKTTPPEPTIPDQSAEPSRNLSTSKRDTENSPQQAIRIRKDQQSRHGSNLQPQPRLASLTIQGGVPGTIVFVDQTLVGVIQPDGALSVYSVNPGDHVVELRKERFKTRELKEHFVAGGAISLAAVDVALESAPGELKINFSPADAKVALVKGDFLAMVSSGVPLNLAAGIYTLTARTADGFRNSSTLEVIAGQSKTLDLSFAPNGMSKWDDPGAWKSEKDSYIHKGGNFVLYGVVPASGTFAFSVMPAKGHLLQWVVNYIDSRNYVLFQMDENNFHRTVIHDGERRDEIIVPDKSDKKSFRTLHIRVSPTEIVHQIRHGDSWIVLDRWTQPGTNLSLGKFGFYIPGDGQVALSGFAHYADLNIR